MTDDHEGVAAVTRQDVITLLGQLQPGTVHSSTDLYKRFIRNLKGTFRPVPHATALGHALRAAGCESKRVRTSRGSRKNRVVTEVASWVIPGTPAKDLVNPVTDLVIRMGEGDHQEDEIFRQYGLMYWNQGWGTAPLSRHKLLVELTNMGIPRVAPGQHVRHFPTTVR
jgi:hypothetical protein